MSVMFMLLQKLTFDGKCQICLSRLSKLTTGNAFRLQWYQNHSNFHCYQQIQSFLITLYIFHNKTWINKIPNKRGYVRRCVFVIGLLILV
jgi:hypothetical protein